MKPYRYSMEVHEAFIAHIAQGATKHAAANAIGTGISTVGRWLERGRHAAERWEALDLDEDARSRDPDWEMAQFYLDTQIARGKYLAACAQIVTRSALGHPAEYDTAGNCIREEVKADPRMALEVLARRDRANWARDPITKTEDAPAELDDLVRRGEALVAELADADT